MKLRFLGGGGCQRQWLWLVCPPAPPTSPADGHFVEVTDVS